jgi:hypothetical protein
MDNLKDILAGRAPTPPPESQSIKKYIHDNFQREVTVIVREQEIIIEVPSAGLANTLRLQSRKLQAAAGTNKRLVFRIA